MAVHKGDKWAGVECTGVGLYTLERLADDGQGGQYVAEMRQVYSYAFLCVCGKEFVMERKGFRGKKHVRDCGCGRGGTVTSSVVVSFSTTVGMKGVIDGVAKSEKQAVSYLINTALREYFERRVDRGEVLIETFDPRGEVVWAEEVRERGGR